MITVIEGIIDIDGTGNSLATYVRQNDQREIVTDNTGYANKRASRAGVPSLGSHGVLSGGPWSNMKILTSK